jgi:hypothetical protein
MVTVPIALTPVIEVIVWSLAPWMLAMVKDLVVSGDTPSDHV